MSTFIPGTVLISRNINPAENHGWGYWNHAALVIENDEIIEATDSGVRKTTLDEYKTRTYIWIVLSPQNQEIAQRAADVSKTLLGIKYRFIASIFVFQRNPIRGMNCVSLIRYCYTLALGYDPMYRLPDDIVRHRFFVIQNHS